jgi:hypothetical protein
MTMAKKPGKPNPGGPILKVPTKPKKPTHAAHKTKMTAKQYRQYLHYLKVHHYGVSAKAKAVRPVNAGIKFPETPHWVLGGNDTLDTCTMTALANHLLFTRQCRVQDNEILIAGEDLSLKEAILRADEYGLGGIALKEAFPIKITKQAYMMPGTLLALDTEWGPHAVMSAGGGLIVSWGRVMRLTESMKITEAWCAEWEK